LKVAPFGFSGKRHRFAKTIKSIGYGDEKKFDGDLDATYIGEDVNVVEGI